MITKEKINSLVEIIKNTSRYTYLDDMFEFPCSYGFRWVNKECLHSTLENEIKTEEDLRNFEKLLFKQF